ncbi:DUF262 domain-containing protein [bacterium]|nr:DUF262 domain-containing protein [bacterium]
MPQQKYSVTQQPIDTLLSWVKSGEIAIPEIQRPFVWSATKVRDLLDSLLQGYPVGYLIAWRNPTVRLKDGTQSAGKRILIDGQQRVTALMASLLGREVVTKDYETVRIRIAYHPIERRFEVTNPAIKKDKSWLPDIAEVFAPTASMFSLVNEYCQKNESASQDAVFKSLEGLRQITNNSVGLIELEADLGIETVTEVFIRVNSAGTELSQADFAMSKIASSEQYDGHTLRKAIDYFCHLTVAPEFHGIIADKDKEFAKTDYFQKMSWLKQEGDDIYDPAYTDMLRVAYTSEFGRGRLEDLVALLSGRNFETKQYEATVAEESFERLRAGIQNFMSETNFKRFVMIIRSAGFVDATLVGSQNALNVAYILYLLMRRHNVPAPEIESFVRKWFVLSMLTQRYSGSAESTIDFDVRQFEQQGFHKYIEAIMSGTLSDSYWSVQLPQEMVTSSSSSPAFRVFRAAQVKLNDKGFLSRDITVQDLILNRGDHHHIFPKNYLKKEGASKGIYNQIANYAVTQSEINIAIGDLAPSKYFSTLFEACSRGQSAYGAINDLDELKENLRAHCIPDGITEMSSEHYSDFLDARRTAMADRMRMYFRKL